MAGIKITQKRYDEIVAELDYLKTDKMAEIEEDIKEARAHGDLSENSEYDAAKDAQGQTNARILELQEMLENAEIIDESAIDISSVNLGVIVTVENVAAKSRMTIKIVGEADASISVEPKRISNTSPIGSALMGHKKGDVVAVAAPAGVVNYKIVEISK